MATQMATKTASHLMTSTVSAPTGSIVGVVVSAGKMQRTVKVQTTVQKLNQHIKRNYREHPRLMVHDPADSLREGDVVRIAPWSKTKKVNHVVTDLMVPFGPPAGERPALLSLEQLLGKAEAIAKHKEAKRGARLAQKEAAKHGDVGAAETR